MKTSSPTPIFSHGIVLTGGIASGKSSVASIVKQLGYEVIDADAIAHKILDKNANKIADSFGSMYVKDQKVDRALLGKLVFENKAAMSMLDKILSASIKKEILKQASLLQNSGEFYFVDIPLYFEKIKHYGGKFSKVVLVYTPKELALKRLMQRNCLNKQEALIRINAQMDIEEKSKMADFIINNSGEKKELQRLTIKLLKQIKEEHESK